MDINELLVFTKEQGASDLHLISNHPPTLRINGDISPLRMGSLSSNEILKMLYSIMTENQRIIYEENLELDFAVHFGDTGRFRVNAFNTINGPAAVLRDIPTEIKTIEQLKLPPIVKDLCETSKGLILVTGPTGSGKSTTLAAMVNQINKTQSKHILTIEDPVEFIHNSDHSIVNQREVGSHTKSFSNALKSALREDPDVILVGELRDIETISLALTAAETGHLVLGTLHTSSASKTIDRIIDVFSEGDKPMARTMIASSLEAVITQLLLKTSDDKGRVAAHEILIANSAIRNLIRDNKIPQVESMMQVNSKRGMKIMKDTVAKLLDDGIITREESRRIFAENKDYNSSEESEQGF